jgi:hypothetical protein
VQKTSFRRSIFASSVAVAEGSCAPINISSQSVKCNDVILNRIGKDGKTVEILAKADKDNESKIIAKLQELYAKK